MATGPVAIFQRSKGNVTRIGQRRPKKIKMAFLDKIGNKIKKRNDMASDGSSTVIDVEYLVDSMANKIRGNQLSSSPDNCTFRTPSILARHDQDAYIPNHFSFGPFHHNPDRFKVSEEIKIQYLNDLLSRSKNQELMLRKCLNSIKKVEGTARDCYAENLDHLSQDQFVEMLVLDGCFIIELFRKIDAEIPVENDDRNFSVASVLNFLLDDLILLENQIPWLVLKLLFKKTKSTRKTRSRKTRSLLKLALKVLKACYLFDNSLKTKLFKEVNINHILDLIRLCLVLPSEEVKNYSRRESNSNQQINYSGWQRIPSATRLQEAGVKFVKVKRDSILDIKFRNGVLEIPSFLMHNRTKTIFQNLVSYEQCLPNGETTFTSYAVVMDSLIDTNDDFEILCKEGILQNWMSPENAIEFFNKIYNDTLTNKFCYDQLSIELNDHCQRRLPRWRAAYVHNYFCKPWAIVAQIYAIIILILTIWQAYKSG